ncbi:erv26 super protein [Arachnomyces sp. PD_36]|nr:erv26 super protein [Arachnomyces sp. PD_36]
MWILPLVGYLGVIVGFSFLTLAIASGLYYLSELVEEHTVLARRLLTRLIYTIILLQSLLYLLDSFPLSLSLLGIASHLVYASNLRRFPVVKLSDPLFILSCGLVLVNHWLWFRHFSAPVVPPQRGGRGIGRGNMGGGGGGEDIPTFTEIASYFGLCVWLVPFALFVSLSAGENVLPSMGSEYATGEHTAGPYGASSASVSGKNKNRGMAKQLVDGVREWFGQTGELMGLWRGDRTRPF